MLYLFEIMELLFHRRCGLRLKDSDCINIQMRRICGMFLLIIVIVTIIFILITTITSNKG